MTVNLSFENGKKAKVFSLNSDNRNYYLNIFIEHLVQSVGFELSATEVSFKHQQSERQNNIDMHTSQDLILEIGMIREPEEMQDVLDRLSCGFGFSKIQLVLCDEKTSPALIKKRVIQDDCIIVPVFNKTEVFGFLQFFGIDKTEAFCLNFGALLALKLDSILSKTTKEYVSEDSRQYSSLKNKKTLLVSVNIEHETFIKCDDSLIKNCSFSECFDSVDYKNPNLILIKQSADIDIKDVVDLVERIRNLSLHSNTRIFYFWEYINSHDVKKYGDDFSFIICNKTMLLIPEFQTKIKEMAKEKKFLSNQTIQEIDKILFEMETNFKKDVSEIVSGGKNRIRRINQIFKDCFGLTLNEYRCIYRVIAAKQMIDYEKVKSVDEIAFSCGFGNRRVFNDRFRNYYKMTPLEYINKKSASNCK